MKKIIYALSGVLLLGCVSSCEDFLDVDSENSLTLDNYFTSYAECRASTAALYNRPWYDFVNQFYMYFGDGRANNRFAPYGSDAPNFERFTENSDWSTIQDSWNALYNVVAQSSSSLNNLDRALSHNVSLELVNQCKGEARFIRGVAYWYLGCAWGNLPIITDPAATAQRFTVNTNPFEDVLQFAIKDMEYAAQWLPEKDEAGRVTKYSAYGMLSRFYLTAASYARGNHFSSRWTTTASEYYKKSLDAAKYVIDNSSHALMNDYEELFRVQNNNNSESLFALQFVPGSTASGAGNGLQDRINYSKDLTDGLNDWGASSFVSGELIELMYTRGEFSREKATYFHRKAVYDYLGTHTAAGKWIVANNSPSSYPTIKKHVVGSKQDSGGAAINGNSGLACPMMRLAEVYLIYTEALMGLNNTLSGTENLRYYNAVRTRAEMSAVDEITRKDLFDEKRIELAMEGLIWFDMLNWIFWDKEYMYGFINSRPRSQYYFHYRDTAPDGFIWRYSDSEGTIPLTDGKQINKMDDSRVFLPYPANEMIMNPLLREAPVPYEFGE